MSERVGNTESKNVEVGGEKPLSNLNTEARRMATEYAEKIIGVKAEKIIGVKAEKIIGVKAEKIISMRVETIIHLVLEMNVSLVLEMSTGSTAGIDIRHMRGLSNFM